MDSTISQTNDSGKTRLPLIDSSPGTEPSEAAITPESDGNRSSGLETISPSRAGDFKQCPLLFRFRAIDRLPEPVTPALARGTTAHLALERLFDLEATERTSEQLFDLFRQEWTKLRLTDEYSSLFADLEEERQWGIDSLRVVANYLEMEDPTGFDPVEREMMISEDLGEVVVRGILDRLDETPDGKLVIVDYKTGSGPPERYAIPAFFALKTYAMLVRRRLGRTPVELRLLYLGNSSVCSIEVDRNTIEGVERHILALVAAIRNALEKDHFPPRPSALCRWCAFQHLCPEGQAYATPEPALPLTEPEPPSAVKTGKTSG